MRHATQILHRSDLQITSWKHCIALLAMQERKEPSTRYIEHRENLRIYDLKAVTRSVNTRPGPDRWTTERPVQSQNIFSTSHMVERELQVGSYWEDQNWINRVRPRTHWELNLTDYDSTEVEGAFQNLMKISICLPEEMGVGGQGTTVRGWFGTSKLLSFTIPPTSSYLICCR